MASLDFDGLAIGGLSVGEPIDLMYEITDLNTNHLPENKPRYLMGVGTPGNLIQCVALGIDMFDCVMPTRNARNRSEEHTSELQSRGHLVCRLLLEKKKKRHQQYKIVQI